MQDIFVRQLIFSQKIKHRLSNLKKSAALFCHYYQKHYLCNHISHIIKEIRNWIILIVAGFFESGFAFCLGKMKEVSGTEWYLWGAGFLVSLALSMTLLAKAVQTLPIGTAYPVWTGIGAVGTVVLGIVFFHEPASFLRLLFITTLIVSIIGLKIVSH